MSTIDQFVFMNLEGVPIELRDENGSPFTLRANQSVKGEFYSRYAKPSADLSMVHEDRVAHESIVRHSKPKNDRVQGSWENTTKRVDPILIQLPGAPVAQPEPIQEQPTEYVITWPEPVNEGPDEASAVEQDTVEDAAPAAQPIESVKPKKGRPFSKKK